MKRKVLICLLVSALLITLVLGVQLAESVGFSGGILDLQPEATSSECSPGETINLSHTISIWGDFSDVVDIAYTSSQGWTYRFYTDPNGDGDPSDGTQLTDTDGDGLVDTGPISNCDKKIVTQVTIPVTTMPGTIEEMIMTIQGSDFLFSDSEINTIKVVPSIAQLVWEKVSGPWEEEFDGSFRALSVCKWVSGYGSKVYIGSNIGGLDLNYGGGVFVSDDQSKTWRPRNNRFPKLVWRSPYYTPVYDLLASSYQSQRYPNSIYNVYAATHKGFLYLSNEFSGNEENSFWWWPRRQPAPWMTLSNTVFDIDSHYADMERPTLYAGSIHGFYRSDNGGMSWKRKMEGMGTVPPIIVKERKVKTIAASSKQVGVVYAILYDEITFRWDDPLDGTYFDGLYKSTNGGDKWENVRSTLVPGGEPSGWLSALLEEIAGNDLLFHTLVVKPTSSDTLYLGTNIGVFRSTDSGTNWTFISQGLPTPLSVNKMAFDPSSLRRIYAATSKGVYVFDGLTWSYQGLSSKNVYNITIDPISSDVLYATTDSGVFVGRYRIFEIDFE